jgi:hypothetical protein
MAACNVQCRRNGFCIIRVIYGMWGYLSLRLLVSKLRRRVDRCWSAKRVLLQEGIWEILSLTASYVLVEGACAIDFDVASLTSSTLNN